MVQIRSLSALAVLASLATLAPAQLKINLVTTLDPSSDSYKGFQAAASLWTSQLTTRAPVTLNINVGYSNLGTSIIGATSSSQTAYDYTAVRAALVSHANSALDATAVASLDTGPSYGFYANSTTTSNGAIHTATDSVVDLTDANAKALGLYAGTDAYDASITFNSYFGPQFDFDRSNGIGANQLDFVGTAAHEIGHALGFISGVDMLDYDARYGPQSDADLNPYHTALDLFRYTTLTTGGSVRTFVTGDYDTHFGFGGDVTGAPALSTGVYEGDGHQASHWKDDAITGTYLGIMDPTANDGELDLMTQNDLNAFDAIGYDLVTPVPEPSALAALGLGAVALLRRRRK